VECQEKVAKEWLDKNLWTVKSILNVARVSKFSSDRSVKDYAEKIWKVEPLVVNNY
jgi:starch phosphorylase